MINDALMQQQQKHIGAHIHTHTHYIYLWDECLDADGSCQQGYESGDPHADDGAAPVCVCMYVNE